MATLALNEPGTPELNIDGTDLDFPQGIGITPIDAQSQQDSAAGRPVFTATHVGDGYPDLTDRYEFIFPFSLSTGTAAEGTTLEFLRKLQKQGGTHTLAIWRSDVVYWTVAIGVTDLYLPRRNAPSILSVAGHGEGDDPIVLRTSTDSGANWTTPTVVMKATVATTDAPGAGNVWIGRTDRQIKLGDSPAAETWIEVVYVPLYTVVVLRGSADIRDPNIEPVALRLVETVEP